MKWLRNLLWRRRMKAVFRSVCPQRAHLDKIRRGEACNWSMSRADSDAALAAIRKYVKASRKGGKA